MRAIVLSFLAILLATINAKAESNPCAGYDPCLILVRHAEKVDSSRDAALSDIGHARARRLATLLKDWKITLDGVHSTDYARTRDTAAPSAKVFNRKIDYYDPSEQFDFAALATGLDGVHLIVGHSNTIPQLAEFLGAEEGAVQISYNTYGLVVVLGYRDDDRPTLTLLDY